ncbi:MAG: hypothetical protein OES90_07365 [Xanthomonadales bacterium]|nr:hypothetical protein [Xanthomonadales bacterium]
MSLSRQQLTLLGIFAMFFGPLLLVMMMRSSWWQYQPSGLKNQGLLVQPPITLSLNQTEALEDKWLILYVLDQPCDQGCIDNVTALRQIHRATGRNGEHLAIALLSSTLPDPVLRSRLEEIYPAFNFIADSSQNALSALEAINSGFTVAGPELTDIHTYILDPMFNVVLAYPASADPTDIHKDLKRLLKWADQEGK